MKQRVIGAGVLLAILIGSILISRTLFSIVIFLVAEVGFRELMHIKYQDNIKDLNFVKVMGMVFLGIILLNNVLYTIDINFTILLPIIGMTLPIVFYNNSKKYNINDALYVLGIIFFLGFSFGTICNLSVTNVYQCIFIFMIAFVTDTYAYIGGLLIGKHKLTSISPKKTWEGSIIGALMGTIIGSVYYFYVVGNLDLIWVIILSLVLSILSEVGDLVFSSIKRYFNKKDYSNLIPGHGGILDRFDSVIFVALGMCLLLSIL